MSRLEAARVLARSAHAGQVDKAGRPYHLHVEAVAAMLVEHGEDAQIAGLLHDVLEDTDLTDNDLRQAGIPEHVISAVVAVTRCPNETYMEFIRRAAEHPLGRLVKLADNAHNSSRLDQLAPDQAASLRRRYERARAILEAD